MKFKNTGTKPIKIRLEVEGFDVREETLEPNQLSEEWVFREADDDLVIELEQVKKCREKARKDYPVGIGGIHRSKTHKVRK